MRFGIGQSVSRSEDARFMTGRGRYVADTHRGQVVTGSLMDYAVPRADALPNVSVDFSPVPSKSNPIGVKGVGEGGTVAATPTVMNAIIDALAPLGISDIAMPATAERVWRAIRNHSRAEVR